MKSNKIVKGYFNSPDIRNNKEKDIKNKVDFRINKIIIRDLSVTDIPIISEELDSYKN